MNVILLTLSRITDISKRGIYTDLIRKFHDEGHNVYVIVPEERGQNSWFTVHGAQLVEQNGVHLILVKTLNIQKTNLLEKGIGQLMIENQFKRAIKQCLNKDQFDLILYSTPPITFPRVITCLKQRNPQAVSYLLLKDIFPQNAVDLGIMSKSGIKGLLYRFFRHKEKRLYAISDYIGCMSPANVAYIRKHNPQVSPDKVEVAPNSIEPIDSVVQDSSSVEKKELRLKYHIPFDVPVFIYGGNLGKPQGISFLIECLEANASRGDCHFMVIGSGTELPKLKVWNETRKPKNVTIMDGLPKAEYDMLVRTCDVGLIFLDHRFTIPNFPSRLLSYLENKMPVLCATDPNCDMGRIVEENGFGYWCESNSVEAFTIILDKIIHANRTAMGEKGYSYLKNNYLVEHTYSVIMNHLEY